MEVTGGIFPKGANMKKLIQAPPSHGAYVGIDDPNYPTIIEIEIPDEPTVPVEVSAITAPNAIEQILVDVPPEPTVVPPPKLTVLKKKSQSA